MSRFHLITCSAAMTIVLAIALTPAIGLAQHRTGQSAAPEAAANNSATVGTNSHDRADDNTTPAAPTDQTDQDPSPQDKQNALREARESLPLGLPERDRVSHSRHDRRGGAGNATNQAARQDQSGASDGTFSSAQPTMGEIVRVAGALAAVIGLIFLCRAVMRRAGLVPGMDKAGRPSGVLEILARYPIARRQYLVLLKLGRRIVLVHQNGQSINTVTEVSDPDEVALLLSRVQGGSSAEKDGSPGGMFSRWRRAGRANNDNFHAMLDRMGADFDRAGIAGSRPERTRGHQGSEIVDLTRGYGNGLSKLLSRRRNG